MCMTRGRWSSTLAMILMAPILLGTTYKWVDPQGQVHLTDTPPPAGTTYEIIAANHELAAAFTSAPAGADILTDDETEKLRAIGYVE